jgi:NTP pyrophosphatase (non-canonical NTP hydrolase)
MSKIQTLQEYQELAIRTYVDLGSQEKNSRHMTLGVITETGEVIDIFKKLLAYNKPMDLVNLGEEIADIAWYVVNNCTNQNLVLNEDFEEAFEYCTNLVKEDMFNVEDLSPEHKSEAILIGILSTYCIPLNNLFNAPIVQLAMLRLITSWYDLDFFQCLTNNIDKLKVRYPEKFTEEAAQNRNLGAERVELEKE